MNQFTAELRRQLINNLLFGSPDIPPHPYFAGLTPLQEAGPLTPETLQDAIRDVTEDALNRTRHKLMSRTLAHRTTPM